MGVGHTSAWGVVISKEGATVTVMESQTPRVKAEELDKEKQSMTLIPFLNRGHEDINGDVDNYGDGDGLGSGFNGTGERGSGFGNGGFNSFTRGQDVQTDTVSA